MHLYQIIFLLLVVSFSLCTAVDVSKHEAKKSSFLKGQAVSYKEPLAAEFTENIDLRELQADTPSIGPSDIPSLGPSDIPSIGFSDIPSFTSGVPSDVPSTPSLTSDGPSVFVSIKPSDSGCEVDNEGEFFRLAVNTTKGNYEIAVETGCIFSLQNLDPDECDLADDPDSYETFDLPGPWLNRIAAKVYGGEIINNTATFTGAAAPALGDIQVTTTRRFIILKKYGVEISGTSDALNGIPLIWETFTSETSASGFDTVLRQIINDAPEVFLTNENTTCGFPRCI